MKNNSKSLPNSEREMDSRKFTLLSLGSFAAILLFGALIFLMAGRFNYVHGWILFGICLLILLITIVSFRNQKELIEERRNPGPGVKKWDHVIIFLYQIFLYTQIVVSVLDSGRFRWTPEFPLWLYVISGLLFLGSLFFVLWAKQVNNFFSSKVRIQKERNHRVVSTGPYRFVRHPGYTGIIFTFFSMAILMGSLWALIPAGCIAILFIIRTVLEDRVLSEELSGYLEYSERVHYRLIPGIW
jgi:protein-S-isoprenylcysteine O-methyltransferase Ste14